MAKAKQEQPTVAELVRQYNQAEQTQLDLLGQIIAGLAAEPGPHYVEVNGIRLMNHNLSDKHTVAQFINRAASPIVSFE